MCMENETPKNCKHSADNWALDGENHMYCELCEMDKSLANEDF